MLKFRILLLALSCLVGAMPLRAQTTNHVITLNGHMVHATRIMVKYAGNGTPQAPPTGQAAVLGQAGMVVSRQFTQLPGWATLDIAVPASPTATASTLANQLNDRIKLLKSSQMFEYVEPDYIKSVNIVPLDARFADGTLWGLFNQGQNNGVAGVDIGVASSNPNVQKGWDITTGNPGATTNVIVAVIDSGIRYTHRDLAANMWRNPGENGPNTFVNRDDDNNGYVDDIFGINAILGTGDPFDDNGHGTHVAGTIGAAANDGNQSVGVIWRVRLMACKCFDASGFGSTSDIITCIDYAISKGARVINASYGSSLFSQAEFDAVTRARNAGIVFVCSAGNAALNHDLFDDFPANYKIDNIISVAAVDRRGNLANFSDYGLNTVHLGAPGVQIFSTYNGNDTDYTFLQGTSMACPHVAGVAALIRSAFPTATISEVKTRLLKGVKPLASLSGKTITGGMVNAQGALTVVGDGLLEIGIDPADNALLLQNTVIPFTVTVTDVLPVNNATVKGTMPGVFTNLVFANGGVAPDLTAGDEFYTANVTIPPALLGPVTLTLTVTATNKATSVTTHNFTVVGPPANDNFAGAFKVPTPGGVVTGTNTFSSLEANEPFHGGIATVGSSVWWNWAPTSGGQTLVDMSGTSFNFVTAVYTGGSMDTLVPVASVDGSIQNGPKYLNFNAVAGTTYRIAVAGVTPTDVGDIRMRVEIGGTPDLTAPTVQVISPLSGAIVTNASLVLTGTANDPVQSGSGVKSVQISINGGLPAPATGTNSWTGTVFLQPGLNTIQVFAVDFANNISAPVTISVTYKVFDPPNDFFFNAIALAGTSGTITNSTTLATREGNENYHAGVKGSNSIWYSFTAPADGILYLDTTNSTFDTLLAVYQGTRVDQLTPLNSNDDAAVGLTYSQLVQPVQNGQKYYIAIDGGDGASGLAYLNYAFTNTTIYLITVTNTSGGTVSPASGQHPAGEIVVYTATPTNGYDFVTWENGIISQANPLTMVTASSLTLKAVFLPHLVSDDFETGNLSKLSWVGSGNVAWSVQATNVNETNTILGGKYFARSGIGLDNNQTSVLTLKATNIAGVGKFSYRVSTEANSDYFSFYLNNTNLASINNRLLRVSGESGWTNFTFTVPAGTNTFQWRYIKDSGFIGNADAVFVDNLDLPLVVPKDGSTPAMFNFISQTGTNIAFRVFGQTNQVYVIQASADLANWVPISTNVAIHGIIQISDPQDVNQPNRFYRAIVP